MSISTASREQELLLKLTERFGALTPTHRVVTHKGSHFYFKLPPNCGAVPSSKGGGLDIRADSGYAVAPPSIHPDGGSYKWDCASPDEMAIAPQWLLAFAGDRDGVLKAASTVDGLADPPSALNKRQKDGGGSAASQSSGNQFDRYGIEPSRPEPWSEGGVARLRSALAAIPADNRDVWLKVGFALHDLAAADPRWPGRAMWDEWSKTCPEKFDPADQDKTWASFGRGYEGPRVTVATVYHLAKEQGWIDSFNPFAAASDESPIIEPKATVEFTRWLRTDVGNARAFFDLFGENLRFVEKWGCWIVWDGARWVEASDIAMLPIAARTTEEMLKWAVAQPVGNADRNAWINHAIATQRDARLRAMINLAKGEAVLRIEPDALDADAWLLGCPNGTLDLRTGKLREARREDYITKQIGVAVRSGSSVPAVATSFSIGRRKARANWPNSFRPSSATR